jgi:hypothetical protein
MVDDFSHSRRIRVIRPILLDSNQFTAQLSIGTRNVNNVSSDVTRRD